MKRLWVAVFGGRYGHDAKSDNRRTPMPIADKVREPAFFVLCICAFLDAILRSSPSSDVTAFRLAVVTYLLVFSVQLMRSRHAALAIAMMTVAAFYMFIQALIYGYLSESIVTKYAALILMMMMFVFLVVDYADNFGVQRLLVFLEAWYVVILVLSFIQLTFSIEFPNAPFRDGVARIYFGQENDTSVAIAAFMPILVLLSRPRIYVGLLFFGGTVVIYLNGTRMVLLAVAFLLCAMFVDFWVNWVARRVGIGKSLIWIPAALVALVVIFVFRNVPIQFTDHSASLSELILIPVK
ncbi:hypothetical protein [Oceaniradius stylonematis]|uniref:hypothetical protein n=1 Tax=Oceaniradius stylonematis TaxID=2184161 RepID=UPI003C7C0A35